MNLVSIITPAYNCSSTILDTYKSIVSQTYVDWEWLITDDCSNDNTVGIILDICRKDSRVRLLRNEFNKGAAESRNNSIDNASGSYLAFIDSDDIWLESKLEKQIKFMKENDASISFTSYELINQIGESLNKFIDVKNELKFDYEDILKKRATFGCSTVILKKDSFDEIRMPEIKTTEDYALWLDLLSKGHFAYKLDEVLMKYRVVAGSVSSNKIKTISNQWLVYRDFQKISFLKSLYYLFFYAKNAIFRK